MLVTVNVNYKLDHCSDHFLAEAWLKFGKGISNLTVLAVGGGVLINSGKIISIYWPLKIQYRSISHLFYCSFLMCITLSKPLDHDKQGMFLPHYLIVWECQGSASRPVDNRGDMAGWSRTRVQGALALDTQRAWACPRSHTAPGDDVMSHAPTRQKRLCLVSSL